MKIIWKLDFICLLAFKMEGLGQCYTILQAKTNISLLLSGVLAVGLSWGKIPGTEER